MMKRLTLVVAGLVVIGGSYLVGSMMSARKADAQIINSTVADMPRTMRDVILEMQEITVDQLRQIVIEEVTKSMIEQVVLGESGGTSGGIGNALGGADGGSAAFINDYGKFIFTASANDTRNYIDVAFDKFFPSYIDASIKIAAKNRYDPEYRIVPDNCVDPESINFQTDPDAVNKFFLSLQVGCNNSSAAALLYELSSDKFVQFSIEAQIEAAANDGLVCKDEESNKLCQSGTVYSGVVQGALEALFAVQYNNQSSISSILGSFLSKALEGVLNKNAK